MRQFTLGNAADCARNHAICDGPFVIARVSGDGYKGGWSPESEAIARMLAAAPELLAALETGYSDLRGRLIQYAQSQFGANYESAVKYVESGVPVLDQMRAAIAKAKGDQS